MGATGELVAVDTFFAGTLKGVGKVYIQTVLDCLSRFVWARLYTSKMPVTAVHPGTDKVRQKKEVKTPAHRRRRVSGEYRTCTGIGSSFWYSRDFK